MWSLLTGVRANVSGPIVWSLLDAREVQEWSQVRVADSLQIVVQITNRIWTLSETRRDELWSGYCVPGSAMEIMLDECVVVGCSFDDSE